MGLVDRGEEELSELIWSVVEEEERELSEVDAEGIKFEEELRVGDGVAGSWERVGIVSGLV